MFTWRTIAAKLKSTFAIGASSRPLTVSSKSSSRATSKAALDKPVFSTTTPHRWLEFRPIGPLDLALPWVLGTGLMIEG